MRRIETLIGWIVTRKKGWVILMTLLLVAVSASGIRNLTFNNDTRVFFSDENPQLKALEALENVYTRNQTVFFAVAPKNGEVFTRDTLTLVEELTRACWQIPYSSRVDSVTNFQNTIALGDELIVADLVENAGAMTTVEIAAAKETALSEPRLVNRLISVKAHVTGINVNVLLPEQSMDEIPAVTRFSQALVREFRDAYPGIDIHLAGSVIMGGSFGQASRDDMATLVPAMFLALLVIAGIGLGSVAGTLATLLTIVFSTATALGIAGWLGISLTTASVNAPTLILTLAVADAIHILVSFFQGMGQGLSREDAVKESMTLNFKPVLLTSLTTAVGFLSMNFSDAPPFRDLGNIVAIGVVAAYFYAIFFLPAVMGVVPLRVRAANKPGRNRFAGFLASVVLKHRQALFWGILVLIIGMSSGITRIQLNDDWANYFDQRYAFRQANDFIKENLTGLDVIEYSLESSEPGGISNPDYLKTLDAFADWYRRQPDVVHVSVFTDTMKRLNRTLNRDDPSRYTIPPLRDLAAQYLLLYEMSLPFGLDLNDTINVDKSATRMLVTLNGVNTTQVRQTDEAAVQWLRANAPPSMVTVGSGLSVIWAHISQRNIASMLKAAFGALVLISFMMILSLKDVKTGLASLVPNLAPALVAFGLWGMMSGQVGLGLSVVAAMTLGIVVDDTVHFLTKYQRARRDEGMAPEDAVRYAFETVGSAMGITTLALVAGFLILSLSGFKMNGDMGLMTAITLAAALVLDLMFLPVILLMMEDKPHDTLKIPRIDYHPADGDFIPSRTSGKRRNV